MTEQEAAKFDAFLRDSFSDGSTCRELRLSEEQVRYIKDKYPGISLELTADDGSPDRKLWYRVFLRKPQSQIL